MSTRRQPKHRRNSPICAISCRPPLRAYANIGTDQTDTVRWVLPGAVGPDGRYIPSLARALAAKAGVTTKAEEVPIVWHRSPRTQHRAVQGISRQCRELSAGCVVQEQDRPDRHGHYPGRPPPHAVRDRHPDRRLHSCRRGDPGPRAVAAAAWREIAAGRLAGEFRHSLDPCADRAGMGGVELSASVAGRSRRHADRVAVGDRRPMVCPTMPRS